MTTLFLYQPLPNAAYQFNPTLDGQQCTAFVPWGLFGRRLYFSLFDTNGIRIVTRALVGSTDALAANSASWAGGNATVMFLARHGFAPLTTLRLTVAGFSPAPYNGTFDAFVVDRNTVSYAIASDPGLVTRLGTVSYDVDLVAGYFTESTLVFRESAQQFEVNP